MLIRFAAILTLILCLCVATWVYCRTISPCLSMATKETKFYIETNPLTIGCEGRVGKQWFSSSREYK